MDTNFSLQTSFIKLN